MHNCVATCFLVSYCILTLPSMQLQFLSFSGQSEISSWCRYKLDFLEEIIRTFYISSDMVRKKKLVELIATHGSGFAGSKVIH